MEFRRVHLIGIGGTGLSAIARVLAERGYAVSGSDRAASSRTDALRRLGVDIRIGHDPAAVEGADVVVRSSAVPPSNPEVQAALAAGIPVLTRREFLPYLTAGYRVIAVAGSHGKTTTTAMLAWALTALGADPTYIIGAEARDLGSNAHAGTSRWFVIEADEYDRMFWGLTPYAAVVTNIEHDHPDMFPTAEDFFAAFRGFAERIAPDGFLLACADNGGSLRLADEHARAGGHAFTYGVRSGGANYQAVALRANAAGGYDFTFVTPQGAAAEVSLAIPGRHNVQNAVAALGVIHLLGMDVRDAAAALAKFTGAGRRFEVRGEVNGVVFVDDYGHHPSEIRATIAAARERYPDRTVWVVWQPHTYSRTLTLLDEFAEAFHDADAVVVTPVFAAREAPPAGFEDSAVAAALHHPNVRFAPSLRAAADLLIHGVEPPAVVLVLSAGDAPLITKWAIEGLEGK